MASIKRNSRTNLILDRERTQKGGEQEGGRKGKTCGGGGEEIVKTFVKKRADQNFTVGICRCLGDDRQRGWRGRRSKKDGGRSPRKHRLSRIGGQPRIVIFTTSARQKKRLFAMVRCAAMTVVRVKLVTMLPRRRPLRIDRSYG